MKNTETGPIRSLPLDEIARQVGARPGTPSQRMISGAAPFESAGPTDLTFAHTPEFLRRLDECRAGAVLVPGDFDAPELKTAPVLLFSDNPRADFARIVDLLSPPPRPEPGIGPGAFIGADFEAGPELYVGPAAHVGDGVTVGSRVTIHAQAYIGDNVTLGDDVVIFPHVTLMSGTKVGNRVVIQAGTVVGADGFGYAPENGAWKKIPHTGFVQIDDDCEIGALNAIDRAGFGRTWIKKGVKTDNLVHIGHNVTVGENSLLVAQVGLSGSVTIGRNAILAGQAGVSQHLTIGDNAIVAPRAGVIKDVEDNQVVSGNPCPAPQAKPENSSDHFAPAGNEQNHKRNEQPAAAAGRADFPGRRHRPGTNREPLCV